MTKSRGFQALLFCNVLLLLLNVGWGVWGHGGAKTKTSSDKYPLLSKRIFADNPNDILVNFVPLRKNIETRLSRVNAPYSFYFEYLPSGTSIRIGDDNELVAASLIKLPVVMNLYRAAELGRINLDQTVEVTPADIDDGYGDLWKNPGRRLTLREAAQLALSKSDNTAIRVVLRNIQGLLKEDEQSMSALDIDYDLEEQRAVISAKSYGSVLKCLYFACFIDRDDSQAVLRDLTQSDYKQRLVKPLPKDLPVAHKIGTFSEKLSQSDCGIIYIPKRQYLLCMMAGVSKTEGDRLISEISAEVYDFVSRQP